jgi:hypothetical protein
MAVRPPEMRRPNAAFAVIDNAAPAPLLIDRD